MKKIKFVLVAFAIIGFLQSCGGNADSKEKTTVPPVTETPKASPNGIGEVETVTLTDPMEESMIVSGKAIYEMKCAACHKLTDQRVVGPGWAGVTNRRRPEWVMNMITNVDVMLDKDPVAQKLLEECLTRMPNQAVSGGDARAILEFMRKNDMETVGEKDGATK